MKLIMLRGIFNKSFLLLCFLLFISLMVPTAVFPKSKTIFVIESYHNEYEWDRSILKGLNSVFNDKYNVHYFEMDTKRLPRSKYKSQSDLAWSMYKRIKPDLVILSDDNAFMMLAERLEQTLTPVVYLGINGNPRNLLTGVWGKNRNITGVLERPNYFRSIEFINNMIDVKKVAVFFDSGTTSQAIKLELFSNKNTVVINNVQVDLFLLGNTVKWKLMVRNLKKNGYDAAIIGLYHTLVNENGVHVNENEILDWTSLNIPVPPFGFWDFSVGEKRTIGGFVLSGEEQGITAGRIAESILDGADPASIYPVYAENNKFLFSRKQLEKWKIKLPESVEEKARFID